MSGTVRKSGKQVQARQRAREKAAEFRAKQDRLEQLAADYFVAADELDQIAERIVEEITRVRERGERDGSAARERAARAAAEMLTLGASRSEVAERLGITVREFPKPVASAAADASASADDAAGAATTLEAGQNTAATDTVDATPHEGEDERTTDGVGVAREQFTGWGGAE